MARVLSMLSTSFWLVTAFGCTLEIVPCSAWGVGIGVGLATTHR